MISVRLFLSHNYENTDRNNDFNMKLHICITKKFHDVTSSDITGIQYKDICNGYLTLETSSVN